MPIRRLFGRLRSRRSAVAEPAPAPSGDAARRAASSPASPDGGSDGAARNAEAATEADRRAQVRIRHFGWARFAFGEEAGQGLVTDLSVAGAFVERPTAAPAAGAKLELRLKPAGGHPTLAIDCEVVRVEERGFALRFAELSPGAAERLAAVVAGGESSAAGHSASGPR